MLKHFTPILAASIFALGFSGLASAAPIGAESPVDGYHPNTGIERFHSANRLFAIELMDSPGGEFGEFGIYYDTDHRVTLFGSDDLGQGQAAMIDLVAGSVMDIDAETYDYFDPRRGDFGFYFSKNGHYIYSEAHLNAGLGLPISIGSYESMRSDEHYLITLEWWDADTNQTWAIEAVGGIRPSRDTGPSNAVPEPSAAMLFGLGALVMRGALRRRGR